MLTFDLNRLKNFYAVYQHRSLVGAAQALGITRSAVSQSLKALEADLGLRLFLRDSKKVIPTPPAEQLIRTVEPFLSQLQWAVRQLSTGQQSLAGHLRIGAPQDFGSTTLTAAIVEFRRKFPEVTFELALGLPVPLLKLVSEGKLDLAFVDNGDIHAKDFPVSISTVVKEKLVLACSKKYFDDRLKSRPPKLAELKKIEFVDYLHHAPLSKIWLKHHFGRAAPTLNVSFCAESVRAVIRAVQGGLGAGVVPEHLIEVDLKAGRLLALCPTGRAMVNQITLARRLERTPAVREQLFVKFIPSFLADSGLG